MSHMATQRHHLKALVAVTAALLVCGAAHAQEPGGGGERGQGRGMMAGATRLQGEVTAVNGSTVTIKAEDGTTYQVVTTDNTRIMHSNGGGFGRSMREGGASGAPPQPPTTIKVADIKTGDAVMTAGQMDAPNKTLHALMIFDTDASVAKAMRENLGKTYITGKVTAVDLDNAKLTVERPDKVSQTIQLDESTSFRRGRMGRMGGGNAEGGSAPAAAPSGESITLADVKVGDNVAGTGAVKNGSFVPAQLTVMTPGQGRGPRPGAGAQPAAEPAK